MNLSPTASRICPSQRNHSGFGGLAGLDFHGGYPPVGGFQDDVGLGAGAVLPVEQGDVGGRPGETGRESGLRSPVGKDRCYKPMGEVERSAAGVRRGRSTSAAAAGRYRGMAPASVMRAERVRVEGMAGTARPNHAGGRAPVGDCLRWRRSRIGRVTPTQCRGS